MAKSSKRQRNHYEEREARIDDMLARAKRLAERARKLKQRVAKLRRDHRGKKRR